MLRIMSKLTLSIEQEIIEKAKEYAKSQGRSLSNIIEEYLKSVTLGKPNLKQKELSKIVNELRGSLKLPTDSKSYKELLEDNLFSIGGC